MAVKRMRWVLALALLVVASTQSQTVHAAGVVNDRELATVVVGKDSPAEVERKLGNAPCLVPSASGETLSYLYNIKLEGADGGYGYLRLEVNGQVDAITISEDPPLAGVCYAPIRKPVSLRTAAGLQLGATQEDVARLYGKPTESFSIGRMTRFRYVAMLDRPYEWDLVFRDGRLVEWTVVTEE